MKRETIKCEVCGLVYSRFIRRNPPRKLCKKHRYALQAKLGVAARLEKWKGKSPNDRIPVVCADCKKHYSIKRKKLKVVPRCRKCWERFNGKRVCQGYKGACHPGWKGGFKYYQPGKLGTDKDGLSWSVQQKLAWVRDSCTCQECGKSEVGWRPDVHHVVPFRVSLSHHLDNLKCLCRGCHKRADARFCREILK